nr:hypothetical protein [Rhizoctonia sp.]
MLKIFIANIVKVLSSLFLILLLILTFYYIAVFIQSIGFGNEIFSGLLISSLLPVKPGDDKPSRKLTKEEKAALSLSEIQKEILVGLLLGELCCKKQIKTWNPRLVFEQGVCHKDYVYHLYELFKDYCLSAPKMVNRPPHVRTGEFHTSVQFSTMSLPCFNGFYNLFYSGVGKKVVPSNIKELLTPLGLAFFTPFLLRTYCPCKNSGAES